jgi:hypothetical protein
MQPEVPDELARGREPAHVADHRHQHDCRHDVDAGDRQQLAHVGVVERVLRDELVELGELLAQEIELAQAAIDVSRSSGGSSCPAIHARPLLPNGVACRIAALRLRCNAAAISFLICVRRLTSPRRRHTSRRSIRTRPSPIQTAGIDPRPADRRGPWHRPCRSSRAWLIARTCLACASTTSATYGSRSLAIRQRIPSRLHHDQVGRREALREQLKQLRRSGQPTGGARAGGVSDRDLTMVAMHV